MQVYQSPEPVKVVRYDTITGKPLPYKFDPYTGFSVNKYDQPIQIVRPIPREPSIPHQPQMISQPPSNRLPPIYQNQGQFDQIAPNIIGQLGGQYPIGAPMVIDPALIQVGPLQCSLCRRATGQTVRRKIGSTAIGWGVCLWFWTGWLCWVPCVMDGCKDAELVCASCNNIKNVINAPCCC